MPDPAVQYPFLKGHGTENDFVLLLDAEGTIHGDLDPARVRALCDRRAGIGGDGVLRVIHTAAIAPMYGAAAAMTGAEWFMDYRNADGTVSEMCGNGIRVFARYLLQAGRVDPGQPIPIGTRDGIKTITVDGDDALVDDLVVDIGTAALIGESKVTAGEFTWPAVGVDVGNPHAVVFVDSLDDAGPLTSPPTHDEDLYPDGVNVEFVIRRGPGHVAMRVHERGSGETRSCGTGAAAVMVAAAVADGRDPGSSDPRSSYRGASYPGATYIVDVPGGQLRVTWREDGHVLLAGPAVIVASGVTDL